MYGYWRTTGGTNQGFGEFGQVYPCRLKYADGLSILNEAAYAKDTSSGDNGSRSKIVEKHY
jgi:hypothetical protein